MFVMTHGGVIKHYLKGLSEQSRLIQSGNRFDLNMFNDVKTLPKNCSIF